MLFTDLRQGAATRILDLGAELRAGATPHGCHRSLADGHNATVDAIQPFSLAYG